MYPQCMFWIKNKKIRYTPAYPSFAIIKVGFRGVYIAQTCFPDELCDAKHENIKYVDEYEFICTHLTRRYL